jgi:uncharacterized membrane protein YoaK (UPF0700 family)
MFVASTPPSNSDPVDMGLSGRDALNARRNSPRTSQWLYFGLALVGGYGDAAGFVIAKTFTGHATGSLVLATIGVAAHDWQASLGHISAVVLFLAGIPLSIVMDRVLIARSSWTFIETVMSVEILLILASYLVLLSRAAWRTEAFVVCMALALGLQNGAFQRGGGISVHTTYLTGTITSLISTQMERFGSSVIPTPATPDPKLKIFCGIWIAFVLGSGAGAAMVLHFGGAGILGAALLLLAVISGNSLAARRSIQ